MSPASAAYKMFAIQCSNAACQAAIGVTDYYNLGSLLKAQEKKLKEMEGQLSQIQSDVRKIAQAMRR